MRILIEILVKSAFWFALIAVGLLLLIASATRGSGVVMWLLILPVILLVSIRVAIDYRRWRAGMVLGYLEQAMRLNLPLTAMLDAAARSESPAMARQLSGLSSELKAGMPVELAVAVAVRGLPQRFLCQLQAAEQTGRLPQVMRRIIDEMRSETRTRRAEEALIWAYSIGVALFLTGVLVFTAVIIVPKLRAIFADYGMDLPPLTAWVIQSTRVVAPLVLLVVAAAVVAGLVLLLIRLIRSSSGRRSGGGLLDALLWRMPIVGRARADRERAALCDALGDAFDAGFGTAAALERAAGATANEGLRRQVEDWGRRVADGEPLANAARGAGIAALIVGVLSGVSDGADPTAAMRFLASYYRARFSRLEALLRGGIMPAVVLALSIMAGTVVLAMFLPLVTLIDTAVEIAL